MHEWNVGDRCITTTEHLIKYDDNITIPRQVLGRISEVVRITGCPSYYSVTLDQPFFIYDYQYDIMVVTSKRLWHIPKGLH